MHEQPTAPPLAVIITALPVEYKAVKLHLSNVHENKHPNGTIYECGDFIPINGQQWRVGIAEIGAGNQAAAFEAERAINYLGARVALFIGIAGGLKDVAIGDVVAADKIYGYEGGRANREFKGRPSVGESSHALVQRARAEVRNEDWCRRIIRGCVPNPRAFVGPIASGEKVVASTRSKAYKFIQSRYDDALAVEMEGRGFFKATHANSQVDALVIRGISDMINDKITADRAGSQELAAQHASAFGFEVLAKFALSSLIRYKISLEGSIDTDAKRARCEQILAELQEILNDRNLKIVEIREGSIIIILEGISEGFERLQHLVSAGKLTQIGGLPILSVSRDLSRESALVDSRTESKVQTHSQEQIAPIQQNRRLQVSLSHSSEDTVLLRGKTNDTVPAHFVLEAELVGHSDVVRSIAWSFSGTLLASASHDQTIRLWSPDRSFQTLEGPRFMVNDVAWSPDSQLLASAYSDRTIRIWDQRTGKQVHELLGHEDAVNSVSWSPDGKLLASGSADKTVRLWNTADWSMERILETLGDKVERVRYSKQGELAASCWDGCIYLWGNHRRCVLNGHSRAVLGICWSKDGRLLASGSADSTIRVWDTQSGHTEIILDEHTDWVHEVSFSFDNRLLASKSSDGTVKLWVTDTWNSLATLSEPLTEPWLPALEFHPFELTLATFGEANRSIRVWRINEDELFRLGSRQTATHYKNVKVVLVGDSGVGKTALAEALNHKPFRPKADPTHERKIWTLSGDSHRYSKDAIEFREVLLWDIAGQTSYRPVHQFQLHEVALALVVFDAHAETDPIPSLHYWNKALRKAQETEGRPNAPLKKLLIAARTDRPGVPILALLEIEHIKSELDFSEYIETSAKNRENVDELRKRILALIEWDAWPPVVSNQFFQAVRRFLVREKQSGQILESVGDLFRSFEHYKLTLPDQPSDLVVDSNGFEEGIRKAERIGLVSRLRFGGLVLMRPELLDAYAAVILIQARSDKRGLGSVSEEVVLQGQIPIPTNERVRDRGAEQLLLHATVRHLILHEIALPLPTAEGNLLVFPSLFTRKWTHMPEPPDFAVVFRFNGPIENIYATLAVRLARSEIFQIHIEDMWQNVARYHSTGGICGMMLKVVEAGAGELSLFFDENVAEETRFQFEQFVNKHLEANAVAGSVSCQPAIRCPECKTAMDPSHVQKRRELGRESMKCPVCEGVVSILDSAKRLSGFPQIQDSVTRMTTKANTARDEDAAESVAAGKAAIREYDVFISYNRDDQGLIMGFAKALRRHNLLPWLDTEIQPGKNWHDELEKQINQIKAAVIVIGPSGLGPWVQMELRAILSKFVEMSRPVIPVIMRGCQDTEEISLFLKTYQWVDFRKSDPDPWKRLLWGITGKRMRE